MKKTLCQLIRFIWLEIKPDKKCAKCGKPATAYFGSFDSDDVYHADCLPEKHD